MQIIMSGKSSHKDLQGSCISIDQVLSVAVITILKQCQAYAGQFREEASKNEQAQKQYGHPNFRFQTACVNDLSKGKATE